LQSDELAFLKRVKIRTIQLYVIRGVLDQHQGCKFMGTQHLRLLGYRRCVCLGACMKPVALRAWLGGRILRHRDLTREVLTGA
jgi:hypothetical protein